MSSAGSRSRWPSWALLAGLVAAVTAAVVFANVLASRRVVQADLTAAGQHRLSPRARALLTDLDGSYEIVLALDTSDADRRTLDRVRDVLDAFDRASPRVGFTQIDTGRSAGIELADRLVARLAADRSGELGERETLLAQAVETLAEHALAFERLSAGLQGVRDAIPPDAAGAETNRAYFEQRAAVARVAARELGELAEPLSAQLASRTLPGGLADLNALLEPVRASVNGLLAQLVTLAADLDRFVRAEAMPAPARDAAGPWAADLAQRRDRVGVLGDRLDRASGLPLIDAARALQTGQSLLVVGPPDRGVSAIDLQDLLPMTDALERAGVTAAVIVGQRAEQLVFTALGSLARPDRPIVVLVHAEVSQGVLQSEGLVGEMRRRLAARGIDVVEWSAAQEAAPPDTAELDPAGVRPVVFVTLSPDSTTGSGGSPEQAGAARSQALGRAVSGLLAAGRPLLLGANPSIFPTYGDPDPVTRAAQAWGVSVLSGRPLLGERADARQRRVLTEQRVVPAGSPHPIAQAASGLPVLLPWAVGIDVTPVDGVQTQALLTLDGGDAVWAESSWLRLWQTPRAQREVMEAPPTFDPAQDERRDTWTVGVAAQRVDAAAGRTARLVVIGSNGWMFDPIAARRGALVDGRAPLAFPGNAELFEAAVLWLAGQDELIAPSGEARPVALVKPLTAGQLSVLRWVLIAGLPALILCGGVAHRVLRG